MYLYVQPIYPRTKLEKFFRYLYDATTILMFAAFIIGLMIYLNRLPTTFENYWTSDTVVTFKDVVTILENCTFSKAYTIGMKSVQHKITTDTYPMILLSNSMTIFSVYVLMGFVILMSAFNKYLYQWNIRFFRFKGLVLRTTSIGIVMELGLHLTTILVIVFSVPQVNYVRDYLNHCTELYLKKYPTAEIGMHTVFDNPSYTALLVALAINLSMYFIALLYLIADGVRHYNSLYFKRKYDYTKGFFGLPDKLKMATRMYDMKRIFAALQEEERSGPLDVSVMAPAGTIPETQNYIMAPPLPPSSGPPPSSVINRYPHPSMTTPSMSVPTYDRGQPAVVATMEPTRRRGHGRHRGNREARIPPEGGDTYNPRSRSHSN
eukprot:PhF_6_TR5076/c0_g1_i1/m.7111